MSVPDKGAPADPLELLRTQHSVRRYERKALPRALIDRLMQAMSCAPSAHNRQPWRAAIIEDDAWKHHLAARMGERLRHDRAADGDDYDIIAADASRSYARITAAPVVIVLCLDMADMDAYPDPRRAAAEHVMAVQSVAIAAQNLMLAAHAEGLGTCWMCAPLFCQDTVSAALALPSGWEPQALITVGWPAAPSRLRPRRPPDAFIWRPPERADAAARDNVATPESRTFALVAVKP